MSKIGFVVTFSLDPEIGEEARHDVKMVLRTVKQILTGDDKPINTGWEYEESTGKGSVYGESSLHSDDSVYSILSYIVDTYGLETSPLMITTDNDVGEVEYLKILNNKLRRFESIQEIEEAKKELSTAPGNYIFDSREGNDNTLLVYLKIRDNAAYSKISCVIDPLIYLKKKNLEESIKSLFSEYKTDFGEGKNLHPLFSNVSIIDKSKTTIVIGFEVSQLDYNTETINDLCSFFELLGANKRFAKLRESDPEHEYYFFDVPGAGMMDYRLQQRTPDKLWLDPCSY